MLTTRVPSPKPVPAGQRPAPPARTAVGDTRPAIQRSLGNDYLQRTADHFQRTPDHFQRTAECGESRGESGADGGCCESCELSRLVQTKLSVGPADDAYEQEADRVAERVVAMPGPADVGSPVHPGPRLDIQRLPAAPGGRSGESLDVALPTGGGQGLPAATRAFMEPRFGQDFSAVRVHSDPEAHRLATQIRARAFTYQHHVYLRSGESEHDHRLMAHELTHVVQQRGGATATVQRAISPELEQLEDYLGYGIFDWAITDAEAERALVLLKTLPRFQQAVFFADAKLANRLRENLPEGRLPELDALATGVAGLQPPAATVEDIQSRLSYGLFDWAITDRDAVEALEMLQKLSGRQLATALAAINYNRLMDNLPDARKPELADLYDRGLGLGGTRQTEEEEHPGTLIKSITFRSDHGMMKNNSEDWTSSGALYGEPEWSVTNGRVVSHPISQSRDTNLLIEVGMNVLPVNAPSAPIRLTGRSAEPALNFDFAGSMQGGLNRSVTVSSTAKLPDTIKAIENRQIAWEMQWQDWKHEIGRTSHTIFVTAATPLAPGEVTSRRMRTAVALTGEVADRIGSLDPHPLVSGIMRRWGAYNLKVQLANAWELADNLDRGAQCIDIVRFVQGLLQTVGAPGIATAVVVWARPGSPLVPEENLWPHGGLHTIGPHPAHPTWFTGLMDANGCPNAFEAALRFDHGGLRRYYPGGVSMDDVYTTSRDVLGVFQCFAWLTQIAQDLFNVEAIAATYPNGSCSLGEVRCH